MQGTFLKTTFIWQQRAKLKYSPSCTDHTTSSNMMLYNLKTHLKVFSVNVRIPRVDEVILLGHYICEDIYTFNASKCVSDFNRQSNMVFANFKHANSYIRDVLFHKNCTASYGSQAFPMFRDLCKSFTLNGE